MQYNLSGVRVTDILRDPLWQFVGAVLGVFAIIVMVVLFFAQQRKKALSYEILSRTPLLSAAEEIAGKLQILFQGKAVQSVYLLVIKISNTGNVPITSSDYERPISIYFGKKAHILSGEISESDPQTIDAKIEVRDQSILIEPVLLNSGDSITIKALVSNYYGKLYVDGRIIGIKNISPKKDSGSVWGAILMMLGWVLVTIALVSDKKKGINEITISPIFLIGYFLTFIGILLNRELWKFAIRRLSIIIK